VAAVATPKRMLPLPEGALIEPGWANPMSAGGLFPQAAQRLTAMTRRFIAAKRTP